MHQKIIDHATENTVFLWKIVVHSDVAIPLMFVRGTSDVVRRLQT